MDKLLDQMRDISRQDADDHSVNIIVKDKGRGIPPEHQAHIFERFYRVNSGRQGEGLGIGLAIVEDIACPQRQR